MTCCSLRLTHLIVRVMNTTHMRGHTDTNNTKTLPYCLCWNLTFFFFSPSIQYIHLRLSNDHFIKSLQNNRRNRGFISKLTNPFSLPTRKVWTLEQGYSSTWKRWRVVLQKCVSVTRGTRTGHKRPVSWVKVLCCLIIFGAF